LSVATQPLVRDVLLRDGSTLRLRAPGPEDLDDLKAFYERLSPESRYLRFHGFGRTDAAAADYANADGVDRVALIGRHGERVVAAASYDVLREPGAAEVAFAVADDGDAAPRRGVLNTDSAVSLNATFAGASVAAAASRSARSPAPSASGCSGTRRAGGSAARASRRSAIARTSRRTTCWSCGRRTPGRPR
jgi:hypothetical protein